VHRWSLIIAALALLVLAGAGSALAARVHVRVEGKTQTIFGSTQPAVDAANALDALGAASAAGEFYYHVTMTGFGPYVDQIGLYPAGGDAGWDYKVNGASPPIDARDDALKDGDVVLWYWADFSSGAGPKTLRLVRFRRNCYRVLAQDDAGKGISATGAMLHVGNRRTVRTKGGTRCVGPHNGLLVRATMPGAVRSNALR